MTTIREVVLTYRGVNAVVEAFNAVVEAFWGRMQVELLNRRRWRTRVELANAIFEYIEGFHNRRRRHSALGWTTPIEFENNHRLATSVSSGASP